MFGWFGSKKNEDNIDPTNLTIKDLKKGYVLEYGTDTYKVTKAWEYDWGNNFFADEFQLAGGSDDVNLYVEVDDEISCSVSRPINFYALQDGIADLIKESDAPPSKLEYDGVVYFRMNEEAGYLREKGTENWQEFISWNYADKENKHTLTIEQWGDDEFEAHIGNKCKEYEFSNILPSK